MATKDWRILVYVDAATDSPNPEGTTVDFTLTRAHLLEPPRIGGQRVTPLRRGAESLSWSAVVGDFSDVITGNMTDGAGRMDLAGRMVEVQEDSGSGFANVWGGRLVGIVEADGPGQMELRFADERWKAKDRRVYVTADTAQISPPGLKAAWKSFPAAGAGRVVVDDVTTDDVLLALLYSSPVSDSVIELLRSDLKDNFKSGPSDGITGNFKNLRATVGGNEYEVVSLSGFIAADPLQNLEVQQEEVGEDGSVKIVFVWLAWDGVQTLAAQPSEGQTFDDFVLTMDGAETSENWPIHVGGDLLNPADIITEIKGLYDDHGVRYHASTFSAWDASTNPGGLVDHPLIPPLWLRVRRSWDLLEFTDAAYSALGLIPFVNPDGEVQPKFAFHQHDVDPTTLPEITDSDLTEPGTFDYVGQEIITIVQAEYNQTRRVRLPGVGESRADRTEADDWAADLLRTDDLEVPEFEHDRVANVGRHVHKLAIPAGEFFGPSSAIRFFRQQATEIFDRFGDGPIYGNLVGLSGLDALAPGDWFRLTLSNYPVFTTGDRDGSTLVVQAIETRRDPEGPSVKFLTGGPDDQPLTAPGVALAQNAGRPKHDVDATISSLPAGADRYQLQLRVDLGPWTTVAEGTANETVTIRNLPSDSEVDARVRATALNAIRSAWSATASVSTAALSPPTLPTATANGRSIRLTWTVGEADYPLMVTVNGVDFLTRPLEAGTSSWTFIGLDASTLYTVGVKHVDPYGGESSLATDTATTGTANTLPAPGQLEVIQGAGSDDSVHESVAYDPERFPVDTPYGVGVELSWVKSVPQAESIVEWAENAAFTTGRRRVSAGQASRITLSVPMDGARRWFRVRQELEGFTPSAWAQGPQAEFTNEPIANAEAVPLRKPSPAPVRLLTPSAHQIPAVVATVRGTFVEVRYTPSDRVSDVSVVFSYDEPGVGRSEAVAYLVSADAGDTVAPGRENRHVLFNVAGADFHFEEDFTAIEIVLVPITEDGLYGLTTVLRTEDVSETGSGVRAALTAGGTALADYFVDGTNVTIDVDGNGRPRINASGGGGASQLSDLSDVNTSTPTNRNVLVADGVDFESRALEAADIQSGTFANARISAASVTQHQGSIDHDALLNFVADEHVAHSGVTITGGVGIAGGGSIAASRTLDLDIVGLTLDDGTGMGGLDSLPWHDDGVGPKRTLFSNVPLSIFDNDAGFVTSALETVGVGLTATGAADVQVDYESTSNIVSDANDGTGIGTAATTDRLLLYDVSAGSARVKFINVSQLPFTNNAGDITAVTAGDGLTGGGTSGGVTLNVGAGDGISVAADAVAVDSTVVRTTGTQSIGGVKTFTSTVVVDGAQLRVDPFAASSAVDFDNGNFQTFTNSGSRTITFANPRAGASYVFFVTDASGAAASWTWPAGVNWQNNTPPAFPQVIGDVTIVHLLYDGTNYAGFYSNHSN